MAPCSDAWHFCGVNDFKIHDSDSPGADMDNHLVDFCVRCGSVLPLSVDQSASSHVACPICNLTVEAKYFHGQSSSVRVFFNQRTELVRRRKQDDAEGPTVERKCNRCGHDRQTFATLQTRSADEGQTIFYTCVKCGAKENENS